MTKAPEPKDKLDATTVGRGERTRGRDPRLAPIDWRPAEASVRRLRQRIFTASQAGDLGRVRNLQKLMLRSRANTLVSVRRVTERNAGRLTAGVDGEVALTPKAKMQLVDRMQRQAEPFTAQPVRRVYIPKRGSSGEAPSARNSRDRRPSAIRLGSSTRWSPSGRRGSSRGPTGFGPAAAAMTRSRRSTRPPRARARSGGGCSTPIWRRRSTASPTTTS